MKDDSTARYISTGSLRLDIALGGGVPRGQVVEISGDEGCGKTSLCLHLAANAQAGEGLCAWVDGDHSLDLDYAQHIGVDPNRMYLISTGNAEGILDCLERLVYSGAFTLIVLDAVEALVPQSEFHLPLGIDNPPLTNNLISLTLRRLRAVLPRNRTTLAITHREPKGISAVYHGLSSDPGRLALRLHASLWLRLKSLHPIRENRTVVGQCIEVKIAKNNFLPCFNRVEVDIMYRHGILKMVEVLEAGLLAGLIRVNSGAYTYQGMALGSSPKEVIETFRKDADLTSRLEQAIRQQQHAGS